MGEQAWRELDQLTPDMICDVPSATSSHDPSAPASDGDDAAEDRNEAAICYQDLGIATQRYKEMRQQLQVNLDRLTRLEAAMQNEPSTLTQAQVASVHSAPVVYVAANGLPVAIST